MRRRDIPGEFHADFFSPIMSAFRAMIYATVRRIAKRPPVASGRVRWLQDLLLTIYYCAALRRRASMR